MYTVPGNNNKERAVTVAVAQSDDSILKIKEELDELCLLSETAGVEVVDHVFQRRNNIDSATFIGFGKIKEVVNQALELSCTLIIFNDEISPTQLKNIQKIAGENIKILDRTGLILDIFARHARTSEAKAQVELAQLQYLLPRLTRLWTHLERQMGGVGTRGGPGEAQIEIDRRLIKKRITRLKSRLVKIEKQRLTQYQNRAGEFRIALVGYTNSGKSTLMKALTGADVYIRDQLFATLDTTTRKMEFTKGIKVLLSDTVGFIHKLPHDLVASFKSTLKEAKEADLLLRLVDTSSGHVGNHVRTIENVLRSVNMSEINSIFVFNKIDCVSEHTVIRQLKKEYPDAIFISALRQLKMNELMEAIRNFVEKDFITSTFKINYARTSVLDSIYSNMIVLSRRDEENEIIIKARGKKSIMMAMKENLKRGEDGLSDTLRI